MRNYITVSFALSLCVACGQPSASPVALSAASSQCLSSYQVPQLPGVQSETGYLTVRRGQIFYWLINAQADTPTTPLVIWLNGGPGSPSTLGLFWENGPYRLNSNDGTLYQAPASWNQIANVVYIDQPVGTGYSVLGAGQSYDNSEAAVGQDMLAALHAFMGAHPEFAQRPLYLTGESFGGTYIPWIASAILTDPQASTNPLQLKGISIGDGTVDSASSLETMAAYAYQQGLISSAQMDLVNHQLVPACQSLLASGTASENELENLCLTPLGYISAQALSVNYYDIRVFRPYDFSQLTCYLNASTTKTAVGIRDSLQWQLEADKVYQALVETQWTSTVAQIDNLLTNGINVLIMNGDQDLLINYLGTQQWINKMASNTQSKWSGRQVFLNAPAQKWQINGRNAGLVQEGGGLKFVIVYQSGHLIPMNQPEAALALLQGLIQ